MNTGLTSTHTARGFSVLYHVFAQKQCFLSSSLSILCCLTLHYYTLLLHRFEIFSAPGTIAHVSIQAAVFARLLVGTEQVKRYFFYMKTTFKRIQCKVVFTCYCCFASSLQFSNVIQLSSEGEVNGGGNTKTRSVEAYI